MAGFAGAAWSKHLSRVRRRSAVRSASSRARLRATPWKRLLAPSGVFNASGSQSQDCVRLVPRSGKGQASRKSNSEVEERFGAGARVPSTRRAAGLLRPRSQRAPRAYGHDCSPPYCSLNPFEWPPAAMADDPKTTTYLRQAVPTQLAALHHARAHGS